ncbi:MAG: pyridoxamine 5'-phosphate oxidase [Hydrogenophilales bacterium 28-61-23]|nr:MAG: pyridoxamine 5'-phosphate oxidase [Hydrogenophilales bacterium 28-61-23]
MSEIGNNGAEARRFVRGQHSGVLSTISQRVEGFPFGSVAPFILDQAGCPIILISTLAEHTKNIDADPRVSLIVQPYSPDMQVAGRVTLLGRAQRLADKSELGARYLRFHPQAESYFGMHDFNFYRIEPVRIRYIGGFGKIHWVEPEQYLFAESALAAQETGILEHMNTDHAENLRAYCRHVHGVETTQAAMIGIDPDGFDVRGDETVLRFDFPAPVTDTQQARHALVALAALAKATARS